MGILLDKRIVAALKYDEIPVIENGKIVRYEPNAKDDPFVILDEHPNAPTGFGLRVSKTVKTYILKRRVGKDVKTVSVGRHPDLLIGNDVVPERNARLLAAELSSRLARGEDINYQRKAARNAAKSLGQLPTLGDLFDAYVADYQSNVKQRQRQNTLLAIKKARDRLGNDLLAKAAEDVTWKDLDVFFIAKAGKAGHQTAAEQTIRWVSAVYNSANKRLALDALQGGVEPPTYKNPASIFAYTGKMRTRRELERDYAKKGVRNPLSRTSSGFQLWLDYVLCARQRESARTAADYFLVTLILGARRSETMALRWIDRIKVAPKVDDAINFVDLTRREICFKATKNDHPLVLPIPDYLYKLLKERYELCLGSEWVFPAVSTSPLRKSTHYNDARSFMAVVRRETGLKFTLHDLRRTLANVVNSMALPSLLVKQLLNHRSGDVTALYTELSTEQLLEHMNNIEQRIFSYAAQNPLLTDQQHGADNVG